MLIAGLSPAQRVTVAVVGGGVVGLALAVRLRALGADVILVERGRLGAAASAGNAGWVTPGLATPLPAPGTMAQALRWTLDGGSPLLVRPRLRLDFMRWSLGFAASCRAQSHERGIRALVALSHRVLRDYDALRASGVEFEAHRTGLLFVALDAQKLEATHQEFEAQRAAGWRGRTELLDSTAARRREPALSERVVGAVHALDDRHVRPESLIAGLARQAGAHGVEVVEGAEVRALRRQDAAWRLETSDGAIAANRVVVAAGVGSKRLLRDIGVPLLIEAAKGYSVTGRGTGSPPRHALYMVEAKVGGSPFRDGFRLAGTLEIPRDDVRLDGARIAGLTSAAASYLTGWEVDPATSSSWAGLRPLSSDGLPVIGAVPGHDRLYVATGHGMVGVTLAPTTAALLAPMVLEDRPVPELDPFSPARFLSRRQRAREATNA